jgi:hypothetical protein
MNTVRCQLLFVVLPCLTGCGGRDQVAPGPASEPIVVGDSSNSPREKVMSKTVKSMPTTLEVRPGTAIGPVGLGMRKEELEALQLPLTSEARDDQFQVRVASPLRVVLKGGIVVSIEVTLTGSPVPVTLSGQALSQSSTLDELSRVFPECGPLQRGEGGDLVRCAGGTTLLKQGSTEPRPVSIQVMAR